jgi:hypothetical protein
MFNEKRCLENLKHIVSEYADDENLETLSAEELRPSYIQLAGNLYHLSFSNRLKYKNLLWNIDNLKPEIRSKFQEQLFNTWHAIYKTLIQTDQIQDLPELKKQDFPPLTPNEEQPEIGAQKQSSGLSVQESINSDKYKITASSKNKDLSIGREPQKKPSSITAKKSSAHQFENDWFDKLLDFFASIVGCLSGIAGR